MRIIKDAALAIVVDVQQKIFPHIHESQKMLENLSILVKGLRVLELPIIVSEHDGNEPDPTVQPLKQSLSDYELIQKLTFSCCGDAKFILELNRHNKNIVIIAGIEAHVCVLQTAIDLKENGYQPVVVEDCIGSRKPNDKTITLERLKSEGVILATYESILYELCEVSGTEQFNTIKELVM